MTPADELRSVKSVAQSVRAQMQLYTIGMGGFGDTRGRWKRCLAMWDMALESELGAVGDLTKVLEGPIFSVQPSWTAK